jgi:uncharacterized repeat protein (TIGR01451 family)
MTNLIRALVCVVSLGLPAAAWGQVFTYHLVSEPGDWVGEGITRTFTPANSTLYFMRRNSDNGVDFGVVDNASDWLWDVSVTAPHAAVLVPDNYEEALRYPFNSPAKPGLAAFGEWRGCNEVDGRHVVREVVFGTAGEVLRFAADFEQHCDGGPALRGYVRYNSDVPVIVATPNAAAGADVVTDEGATVRLDGSKSSDGDGAIVAYRWSQAAGPAVTLADPSAPQTTFVAPAVPEGGSDLSFELAGTDNDGNTDTDTVTVHVASRYDPKSTLYLKGSPGDALVGDNEMLFTVNDGDFRGHLDMGQSIAVEFYGRYNYYLTFAAPGNGPLVPGVYEGATRYPFQAADEPGLDLSAAGNGCNRLTGRFMIHEAEYGPDRSVVSFSADFDVQCEGAAGGTTGSVRFNHAEPKPHPVLTIGVTDSPDPVSTRDTLTYTVLVRNTGGVAATGVALQTTFSAKVTPVSADPRCSLKSTAAQCVVGQLAAGASTTLQLVVKPGRKGTLTSSTSGTADGVAPLGSITTSTEVR